DNLPGEQHKYQTYRTEENQVVEACFPNCSFRALRFLCTQCLAHHRSGRIGHAKRWQQCKQHNPNADDVACECIGTKTGYDAHQSYPTSHADKDLERSGTGDSHEPGHDRRIELEMA